MIAHISVIVVTKNEEGRIADCLKTIRPYFSDIWIVDSNSTDRTVEIARGYGARIVNFSWNGTYPKKYGWCLECLNDLQDWVLFIDADEWMNEGLAKEIEALELKAAGYFIKGLYKSGSKVFRFGMHNNKLCLINRGKIKFPVVKDIPIEGMEEIEGHYQPVLRAGYKREKIGQLKNALVHNVDIQSPEWLDKHKLYARWEAQMDVRKLWPQENKLSRRFLKFIFKCLPFRPHIAFLHSCILKLGFLDGWAGMDLAMSRYRYYAMVNAEKRALKTSKARAASFSRPD